MPFAAARYPERMTACTHSMYEINELHWTQMRLTQSLQRVTADL